MTQTETVAVLGAGGTMGLPIARNIARTGIPVRAWNRTRDKAAPLAADGVSVADSPADAVRGAGIVVTMLADADAVVAVMGGRGGALAAMTEGGGNHPLWLQMSTIGETGTQHCIRMANEHGVGFVDAPVLGTRAPAERGELVVLESGPEEARPRVQPVFDAIGSRTLRAGEAGAGTRLKVVANSWVLAVTEAGAEVIALAEGLGLDPDLFFQAIGGGPLDLPYLRVKGGKMLAGDFDPDFTLTLAAKDAQLAHDAARRHDLDLPLIEATARRLGEGAKSHGDEDFSATYLLSTPSRR